MSLQIINRRGYLHEWNNAELQSPPKGNLRRGEIAIAIVTDDGTENGDIVEVIGRIGPSDTPTPFSDCPVVFRSPRGFKGADVRPVLVEEEPAVDSVLAFDSDAKKFVSLSEDPGTYEEEEGGTGGGGNEGDGGQLSEVAPTILSAQVKNLDSQAVVGTNPDYDLEVKVIGRPDPILSIEIDETAWPDYDNNAVNFTTTTAYNFTSDNLPAGVILSVEDDSALASLGVRTYTFGRVVVNRDVAMSRVSLGARIGASNPAGEAPAVERPLQGSIAFVEDPATATADPTLTKVAISEGGSEKSKIANLATDTSTTLTANYVASDFTDGVANGTVSYQWSANGAALVGETNSTLTLTNTADVYNDSQIKVDVTITDDNGTDTRSGYMVVGDYDEGFTELSPSADSKLVYVATDGDDTAAAAAKGRGYYLPSDPEIGPDPMNPVGPIAAYATIGGARGVWGGSDTVKGPSFIDAPDWFLLKRGQTFDFSNVGDPWSGNTRRDLPIFGASGRSDSERFVIGAWGTPSDPRPMIVGKSINANKINTIYQSIDFDRSINNKAYNWEDDYYNVTYEDCMFRRGFGGLSGPIGFDDIILRRCVVVDSFNPGGHNQGLYVAARKGNPSVTVEECVFDRNGYKEDPNEPTTWTFGLMDNDTRPYGEGVQPKRTYFDRNMYLSAYRDMKVRGSIISRGGGGNDLQMRSGGVCERNLFLMNSQCVIMGSSEDTPYYHNDGLVIGNVFLHDEHFIPPGGSTSAVNAEWYSKSLIVKDNVVTKYMRSGGYAPVISFSGKKYNGDNRPESVAKFIALVDNAVHNDGGKYAYNLQAKHSDIFELVLTGNDFWVGPQLDSFSNFVGSLAVSEFPDPSGIRTDEPWLVDSNRYATGVAGGDDFLLAGSGQASFATWQAAGFDPNSTLLADRPALAAAAGWTDPDRSILTYMQAVDPTYVVDEDVYVDDGSTGQKQAVRQKVWEQLVPDFSEASAKLIARNYHAFLAFIEKARNNRKGAWDSRWTAEAVNNYIREGFGKPALGGAYTADLADIPALVAEVSA